PANTDLANLVPAGDVPNLVLTSTASTADLDRNTRAATNHPDGDNLQLLLVDKNANPYDGPALQSIPGLKTTVTILSAGQFRVTAPSLRFLSDGLIQVGQGVRYSQQVSAGSGLNPSATGIITQLSETSFVVQATDPAQASPTTAQPFTVLSGRETL